MKKLLLLFLLPLAGFSQLGLGLEMDDEGYAAAPIKMRDYAFQTVTAEMPKVSLKQYVPAIKNQGGSGTCVGWASAYYAQTMSFAKELGMKNTDSITNLAFSPLFLYRNAKKSEDPGCQKGIGIPTALTTMKETGSVYFKDFAHTCAGRIPDSVYNKTTRYKLKEYLKLFGLREQNYAKVAETRKALSEGKPVVMGMRVQNSFQTAFNIYEPDSIPLGNHAMTVIGYDDNKLGPDEGAFEIVNSWGDDWGNEGYMWVRYQDYAEAVHYGFELVFEEIPQEDIVVKKRLSAQLKLLLAGNYPMEVTQAEPEAAPGQSFQSTVYATEGGGIADYTTKDKFAMGTRYKIRTYIDQPAYVYVFGADTKRPVSRLFPTNDSISAYINAKDAYVMVPGKLPNGQIGRIKLDTQDVTSDYTIAIVSLEKLNPQSIKQQVDIMDGPLIDRFYKVLKNKLIPRDAMKMSADVMGFEAEFEKGVAAVMALDIKRSDYTKGSDE